MTEATVPQISLLKPKISVFGVGGAGGNALNNMIQSNLEGVDFVAANTDAQSLSNSLASNRIQLGVELTKGLGSGSHPERGRDAAQENIKEIEKYLEGNNMVFITAGMGGGTGTGAAPVIAKMAKEKGILTVGVVTKPFDFEGKYRMESAMKGIEELKKHVDTLIIIPNQNLFRVSNEKTTFESAFKMADKVLHAGVRGVTDLITMPGLVNLDFADISTIMTKMGKAMMGTGEAEGEDRALIACQEAISNPLLDNISIKGAKGVLVNMTGGPDMTLFEADIAVNHIRKEVDPDANIIFGSAFNENMEGKIRVSVVATGIDGENYQIESDPVEETTDIVNDNGSKEDAVEGYAKSKVFFDPSAIETPSDQIGKIGAVDFKPVIEEEEVDSLDAELSDEEHPLEVENKIEEVDNKIANDIKVEVEDLFKAEDLKSDDNDDEDSFGAVASKVSQLEENIQKKEKAKKGFGLFNFMNSKSEKEDLEEESEDLETEVVDIFSKADEKNAAKKNDDSTDFDLEDDILNIPAFFRRKK